MPSSVRHCIIILNKTSQSMKHTGLIPQFPIPTTYNNLRGSEAGAHSLNFKLSVITYVSHYLFVRLFHRPEPTVGESLPHLLTTAHLLPSCPFRVCHSPLITLRSLTATREIMSLYLAILLHVLCYAKVVSFSSECEFDCE